MASTFKIYQDGYSWNSDCIVDFVFNYFDFKWYIGGSNIPKYNEFTSGRIPLIDLFTDSNGTLYTSVDLYISSADALSINFSNYISLSLGIRNNYLFINADTYYDTSFVYEGDVDINDILIINVDGKEFFIYCHKGDK